MRLILAIVLVIVAVYSGIVAYGALSNLWTDYQDSPTSTYLLIGVPALAVCAAALISAVLIARRAP